MLGFKSLFRKARIWRLLTEEERSLLMQAIIFLPLVAFSLQLWGMQRTQQALSRLSNSGIYRTSDVLLIQIQKTSRLVEIAANYIPVWGNCLKKSLVLWFLLRRQGIVSELLIGARRLEGEFQAHAWIEYQGIVINDTPHVRQSFAIFERKIEVNHIED
jgi:Transglutaminase-like superfamily